jgi:outer membrane assembly lipoprotein YfiO
MHIRRQLQALALLAGLILSTAVPAANETLLAEYNYYESGKIELNAGNYQQAIVHYTNFQKRYPNSLYIPQAKLENAYAYYKLGDGEAAIPLLQDFLDEDNKHTHKPYAFYLAGLCKYQEALHLMESATTREGSTRARAVTQQAIDYFSQLVDKFPDSLYSGDARQKTTYLLEKIVLHRIKTEEESASQSRQQRIKAESERSQTLLMKQPASHYTLQLVRAPDYDTAFNVAVQYRLEKNATIIETRTAKDSGYTLLYGDYPTKREAMQAGSTLPKAILQSQPWVREMGSIHAEIVESRLLMSGIKRETTAESQANQAPPSPVVDISKVITSNDESRTPHERWLLSQSPSAFTIQLTGASSEENLRSFITDNNLTGQIAYYKSRRKDGGIWYSLLYGSYSDRAAAIEASREIGNRLNIAQPWIRNFKGIQNEINSAN